MKKLFFILLAYYCFIGNNTAQNVNEQALNDLFQKAEETHSEAIVIYRNNQLVAEKYYGIGHPDTLIEAMSCTKSIVGLATICLLEDGLIDSLNTPVYHFFPEWNQGRKKEITVEHLLTMTSGIQNHPNAGKEIYPSPDFVQLALTAELSDPPGEKFSYNNKALNLLAGIFKKASGKSMDLYIGERLFKPLEINHFTWTKDPSGNPHTMAGCQIRPVDMAKLGLLLLNQGKYEGQQVITVQNITKLINPTKQYKGYGLLWWLDYEGVKYTVDDEIISDLKKQGAKTDFISKMNLLKGVYTSYPALSAKITEVFGENPWPYIQENLGANGQLRKKEFIGQISAYRADGYLGNYIIVRPEENIVAVRMISHKSYNHDDPTGKDGFQEFSKMVKNLSNEKILNH